MKKDYELEFGSIFIYDVYAILVINEDVSFRSAENKILIKILNNHFKSTSFTLISYRIFRFDVDPIVYYQLDKIDNLKAVCVVSEDTNEIQNFAFEKTFCHKEFKFFSNIDGAKNWALEFLNGRAAI
jgi:hypothetical protein